MSNDGEPPRRPSSGAIDTPAWRVGAVVKKAVADRLYPLIHSRQPIWRTELSDEQIESIVAAAAEIARTEAMESVRDELRSLSAKAPAPITPSHFCPDCGKPH